MLLCYHGCCFAVTSTALLSRMLLCCHGCCFAVTSTALLSLMLLCCRGCRFAVTRSHLLSLMPLAVTCSPLGSQALTLTLVVPCRAVGRYLDCSSLGLAHCTAFDEGLGVALYSRWPVIEQKVNSTAATIFCNSTLQHPWQHPVSSQLCRRPGWQYIAENQCAHVVCY